MFASREISVSCSVSTLSDQELCMAIATEVMGWKKVRCNSHGSITGECGFMTTAQPVAPDWLGSDAAMVSLERLISSCGWSSLFRRALADVAGDFNPIPTLRQRAEAALLAARESRKTLLG
jgi:hypothetical protein